MELTYYSLTGAEAENQRGIKVKVAELKDKLTKLEERFGFGEIDRDIYDKLAPKPKSDINQKEQELERVETTLSNRSHLIEKSVTVASKLADLWISGWCGGKENDSKYSLFRRNLF